MAVTPFGRLHTLAIVSLSFVISALKNPVWLPWKCQRDSIRFAGWKPAQPEAGLYVSDSLCVPLTVRVDSFHSMTLLEIGC